jgi:hypothetical protein
MNSAPAPAPAPVQQPQHQDANLHLGRPQQQEQPPNPDEHVREPLRHRLARYRNRWQHRHRRRGWQGWQAPVAGDSLSRMMGAARAVEAHRVRAPLAQPGHLRAPARVRGPVPRVPRVPAVRAPRAGRPRLRLPGRR